VQCTELGFGNSVELVEVEKRYFRITIRTGFHSGARQHGARFF
jgi:hypothetical protein